MRPGLGVAAAIVIAATSSVAFAAPCDDLTADGQSNAIPIVWIENGDTQEPLLKRIGKRLIQTTGQKVRLVYRNRPTCELATNFYGARSMAAVAMRPIRYIPEADTFDPLTSPAPTCDPPAAPPVVMLAIGATYLTSCNALPAKPMNVALVNGPNQAYGFVVPKASSQVAITAEEGYLAFGFPGDTGQATPWIDQSLRFVRGATASTSLTMASNIGLQPGQLRAAAASTTSLILMNQVATAVVPEAAIGMLGTELRDQNRGYVDMLAFQGFGQRYAYYPDSTATAFDKQNVRDGHYLPWSPTPYVYEANGAGVPSNATVKRIVDLILGRAVEADVNGLKEVIDSGLVPECAMKVKREVDGGPLSLYDAPEPCGCFFDDNVPEGMSTCMTCTTDATCGGGKCRFGFCEAR